MKRNVGLLKGIDWLPVFLYLIMVFMGWINIYAAVFNEEFDSIFDFSQRYGKQLIWIVAALVLAVIALLIEGRAFNLFAYIIYGFVILLLIFVLIFGREINGARSWIEIGSLRLQPAEFAKFATGLALARFLSEYQVNLHKRKYLIRSLLIIFFPAVLILLQNDTGSALIYFSFILVLYREGLSAIYFIIGAISVVLFLLALLVELVPIQIGILAVAFLGFFLLRRSYKELGVAMLIAGISVALVSFVNYYFQLGLAFFLQMLIGLVLASIPMLFWIYRYKIASGFIMLSFAIASMTFVYSVDYIFYNILEKHHQNRIQVLLGLKQDNLGAGYNVHQSQIAIGSGGLSGKGFLKGTQTKYNFVPEQSTDFIFCTVGEEWGFVGTSLVLVLFVVFLIKLLTMAERQKSDFSRIYGYAVVSVFLFHILINIGMTIGLAPVIGIPLPFYSYGGSSLWAFTVLLFIFIKLDANRFELL